MEGDISTETSKAAGFIMDNIEWDYAYERLSMVHSDEVEAFIPYLLGRATQDNFGIQGGAGLAPIHIYNLNPPKWQPSNESTP